MRSISQEVGYSERGTGKLLVPTAERMAAAFTNLDLDPSRMVTDGQATQLATELIDYFEARAHALITHAEPNLMNADEALDLFEEVRASYSPTCPMPMNKQKGAKKAEAYLTCLMNMMIERSTGGMPCDYDPGKLTTVTQAGAPLRTLARRVDGAFPASVNPVAIWEIKEYYYTTTFGSRVADGVYETLLDGLEVEELREHENIDVLHYLIVDAHYTWWGMGRSYLCRMFDMLHMGYVDEVLFGREVVSEIPRIAAEWMDRLKERPVTA